MTIEGRRPGPAKDYQEPGDVCQSCRKRWATFEVVDLVGIFDHDQLCDECVAGVPDEYVTLPYVPPALS